MANNNRHFLWKLEGGHIFGVDFHNMNETRRRFEANQTSFDSLTTTMCLKILKGKQVKLGRSTFLSHMRDQPYFFSTLFLPFFLSLSLCLYPSSTCSRSSAKIKARCIFPRTIIRRKRLKRIAMRRRDNSRKNTPRSCEPCAYYITMWPPHGYKLVQNPI